MTRAAGDDRALALVRSPEYLIRVYAAVLGKMIGVYLGRPVESWTYERIMATVGEVDTYLNGRTFGPGGDVTFTDPLVITDDDITGTLTFLRAIEDHGDRLDLAPDDIAQTWLNYVIEGRTILWWGGRGNSTEHTAYLNLRDGIPAPHSGSIARNGPVVAQQIGAQIFIDGWGLVNPGDPERAAACARAAASVSHDGVAVEAAQLLAALEAQAFVEADVHRLYDAVLPLLPGTSLLHRLVDDVRRWVAGTDDWHAVRARLADSYGYDRYPGVCHVVPNHGVITMAVLACDDDFSRAMRIVNTAGWDTDCNAANVGCLVALKDGIAGIDADPRWRAPVQDRLYLPTADGGRAITDAATEAIHVANLARRARGLEPLAPKDGARFHFTLPGSRQGFSSDDPDVVLTGLASGDGPDSGLRVTYPADRLVRVTTPTFLPPDADTMGEYELLACPTLHPGQGLQAMVQAPDGDTTHRVRFTLRYYTPADGLDRVDGPAVLVPPGQAVEMAWVVPPLPGPAQAVGLAVDRAAGTTGSIVIDRLTWHGEPTVVLDRPTDGDRGTMWRRAWVDAADHFQTFWDEPFRVVQDRGTGVVSQGNRGWRDYRAATTVSSTFMRSGGLAVRVQGLTRHLALVLTDHGAVELVRQVHDRREVLDRAPFDLRWGQPVALELVVRGDRVEGRVDGLLVLSARDGAAGLVGGGVGLVCEEGCLSSSAITVGPVGRA